MTRIHSQGEEDDLITAHFGARVGRFLDVGAFDGVSNSNTAALVERGWGGVCVEPGPAAFMRLLERYERNGAVTLVHALIDTRPGPMVFHLALDASVSTTDDRHRERWADATRFRHTVMQAMTPADLLSVCPGPYDFVSIDTEGTSDVIAMAFPFDTMGTSLVCVEYGYEPEAFERHMAGLGFRRLARTENNELWHR